MTTHEFSALAALVSAGCALLNLYMFRAQGKGLVWTKDHKIGLLTNKEGQIHTQIEIPLCNVGKGNIRFLKLKAKKINLKSKAMENFEMDMDEAYFPEGATIVTYRTGIHTHSESFGNPLVITNAGIPPDVDMKEYQSTLNKNLSEIPEHIVIIKCTYKDGSWFGTRTRETTIGLSVTGLDITYLSTARRKELNEYYSW